jgi:transcriptional adapter 2-alpha
MIDAAGMMPPLDLTGMEGLDLLSASERQLCSELRLIPRHYLIVKEAMLDECFRRGYLKKSQARQLLTIGIVSDRA